MSERWLHQLADTLTKLILIGFRCAAIGRQQIMATVSEQQHDKQWYAFKLTSNGVLEVELQYAITVVQNAAEEDALIGDQNLQR